MCVKIFLVLYSKSILYFPNFFEVAQMYQGIALSMVTHEDVRKFFDKYIDSYKDLSNRADSVLLEKGLYVRPPYVSIPERVEFVDERTYIGGFIVEFLGKERPINAMEIAHAFSIFKSTHWRTL
jgi:hypothetical protein